MDQSIAFMVFNKDIGQMAYLRVIGSNFDTEKCKRTILRLMNSIEEQSANSEWCIIYNKQLWSSYTSNRLMFVLITPD